MNPKESVVFSLVAVVVLVLLSWVGAGLIGMHFLFGVLIPYLAFAIFLFGLVARIVGWARSPVPFRIPTTCGQQKSLPWVKWSPIENPVDTKGVLKRMFFEVFLFRSLFRNVKLELREGPKLLYGSAKWLWLGAIAFHYAFLVILIRHFRFFSEPVAGWVRGLEGLDGFLELGVPRFYLSGAVLLAAIAYLFARRYLVPQLRYISLPADYFPLFLIFGIGLTGILMRYFIKVDIVGVKQMTLGLAALQPTVVEGVGSIFYIHIFLVSVLFAYFPFSKLVHLAGVFLSPTRNLANNSRFVRHVNPWNYPVKTHTYDEYEEDFREKMIEAGLPVEKE